ncbi:MAG: thermonuclease family protein [Rhodospirillales bacterium]|nr:thermonuclease family protein [Rhodospirillales bacterium]
MQRLLAAAFVLAPGIALADLAGQPMVLTGDTMQFGERKVTLYGVHAPTITQTCGAPGGIWSCGWDAALYLEEVIGTSEVICTDLTETGYVEDKQMHHVARCSARDVDLAGAMIDAGLAVADETMGDEYAERAMAARQGGTGMWSGPFVDPVTYTESGGCACSARKKAMQDNAELIQQRKDEEAAAEAATN